MKGCELCNGVARMYCESDEASLCWDCDEKVHCANFLVAKHSRCLLCQICQSPTAWKASGPKLGPTVSICQTCFSENQNKTQMITCLARDTPSEDEDYLNGDHSGEDGDGDGDQDEDDQEEEEEGENQVVPWSVTSSPTLPPVASSSSSEDVSSRFSRGASVLKRMRENSVDLDSDDDEIGCSSSSFNIGIGRTSHDEVNSERPLKRARRLEEGENDDEAESRSTAIIQSLKRLQTQLVKNRENASQTILGICRLSRNHSNSHSNP